MNYNTISAQRIAGALGAEIAGVDLSRPLSDEVIGEIRQALLDHQVIFFHDQHLTPEQHLAFGRRFGELQIHDFVEPAEEDQHILEVRKEPYETRNFGGGWHTDVSYLKRPSLGSVLYAREVPAVGGDTMFASQYLAYDALSDGMKAMLGGMTAIHSAGRIYGVNPARSLAGLPSSMTIRYSEEAHGEIEHPVVRTHVETRRKCLYVNGNFTVRFKDMTEEESAPLLSWLYRHASPQYTAALLKLSLWFASCSWRNQPVSQQSALLMAPIGTVAPSLIGRRYKKVKKTADRFDELTPQQRHEFRIAVKKLRYTVEFLKDLFDGNQVAEFVQRLRPLQDDVGYANDVRVAHELLTDLQVSRDAVSVARAAGIALGWHDRGLADLDRKLRKHVRRLRQLRPFW